MNGKFKATPVCTNRNGELVRYDKAKHVSKNNLMVNQGRRKIAELIGGRDQRLENPTQANYINRIILGTGDQDTPNLEDTFEDISQIEKTDGTPFGIFQIEDSGIFYPDSSPIIPQQTSGWSDSTAQITEEGLFIDESQNFSDVEYGNNITLNVDDGIRMVVTQVVSDTELILYNPGHLALEQVEYRIDTPGTQITFSKFIHGNTFDPEEFGPSVIVTEAALLFNDNTMLNRVVYGSPESDDGVLLKSDQTPEGVESSYNFQFTITF